jgi:hypothetical protein
MNKRVFNKIAAGLNDVVKIAHTPSCGCVFCDIGLEPDDLGDHYIKQQFIKCTKINIVEK